MPEEVSGDGNGFVHDANAEEVVAAEIVEEDELTAARREAASHLDDLRRLKAEFENYRKRILKDQSAILEFAGQALVEKLLPVLDAFELALMHADQTRDYEKLVHGVELVFGELFEVLKKEGLQRMNAQGESFDPEHHEAVMQADDDGEGEPFVAEVFRPGYELKGKVIRPAMVKVGKRKP
ncbi:MAG: nucleotide exchange factor GrpE [Actinomycetota bacterium]